MNPAAGPPPSEATPAPRAAVRHGFVLVWSDAEHGATWIRAGAITAVRDLPLPRAGARCLVYVGEQNDVGGGARYSHLVGEHLREIVYRAVLDDVRAAYAAMEPAVEGGTDVARGSGGATETE